MPTPDEHIARIAGNKDLQIAMLCAQIDEMRHQADEAGKENDRLREELAQLAKGGPENVADGGVVV
jgi:peptidoglycan hydrolase CwlO-like protein